MITFTVNFVLLYSKRWKENYQVKMGPEKLVRNYVQINHIGMMNHQLYGKLCEIKKNFF